MDIQVQKPVFINSVKINGEFYDKKTAKFMMLSGKQPSVNEAEKKLEKLKV
jgi:hypothetical protein